MILRGRRYGVLVAESLAWPAAALAQGSSTPVVPAIPPNAAAAGEIAPPAARTTPPVPEQVRPAPVAAVTDGDRVSHLVGARVRDGADDAVGTVADLLLTGADPGVIAVISVGGSQGTADRMIAVPYGDLRVRPDGTMSLPAATGARLKAMPSFAWRG